MKTLSEPIYVKDSITKEKPLVLLVICSVIPF